MALLKLPADVLSRPEKSLLPPGSLERPWHWLRSRLHRPAALRRLGLRGNLPGIHRHAARLTHLDSQALSAECVTLRQQLSRHGVSSRRVRHAFALVREVSRRELGMAHHDVQLLGGLAMLEGC